MAERLPQNRGAERWGWRLVLGWADGYLGAVLVLLGEWLVVCVRARRELVGVHEAWRGLLELGPVAGAAAAVVALGGAWLLCALRAGPGRKARVALGALGLGLGLFVGVGSSGGRLLSGPWRPAFVAAVGVVAAAVGWAGAGLLRRGASAVAARSALGLAATVAALVGAITVANALVLPRLYPALHVGLALLGLWLAALGALGLPERFPTSAPAAAGHGRVARPQARLRSPFARIALALVVLLGCAAAAPWGAKRLSTRDNLRFVMLEHAPTLGFAVQLGAWLAPPPPLDGAASLPTRGAGKRSVDLSGRDLLLVTIDAVRADHIGAWGYGRPVSPHIDALARDAVVFDYAYSPTPHTSYAIASLMTGKYLRPLAQQGVPSGTETWAVALRRYGFRTAAFFPPAAFYIDPDYFQQLQATGLGFEYRKLEFASAALRVEQVRDYLARQPSDKRLFLWVHLFEPHEPYESHPGHDFGDRAVDRYDSEIAAADEGVGAIVEAMRRVRPRSVVIVTADHGEEFGDHGGRYHGTTVYEEQVRVPLLIQAPGLLPARHVTVPVSLVDLVPTVLVGLGVPLTPRLHGRDLGPLLVGEHPDEGFALAETDEQTLLAEGAMRLVCARRVGACRLFDVTRDPGELTDLGPAQPDRLAAMRRSQAAFLSSLGRFETGAEPGSDQASWPAALRRAMAGDGDAALDVASLLDDADSRVRRKAAEVLFELRRAESAPQLRRALSREEDETARRWCALALTRLGQGAPLAYDLVTGAELDWQRLAALALAEAGDDRGEKVLVAWWNEAFPEDAKPGDLGRGLPFQRARDIAAALAKIHSKAALPGLIRALGHLRLRRYVADALGAIGDENARPALGKAFGVERYQDARVSLARALVALGASAELREPLGRFLGVPDPMPGGLEIAEQSAILEFVGGPRKKELERLRHYANSGIRIGLIVPKGGNGKGLRVLARARCHDDAPGQLRIGLPAGPATVRDTNKAEVPAEVPPLDPARTVSLAVAPSEAWLELFDTLPAAVAERIEPGSYAELVVYGTQNVEVDSCAVVPLADELPAPRAEPWKPAPGDGEGGGPGEE